MTTSWHADESPSILHCLAEDGRWDIACRIAEAFVIGLKNLSLAVGSY